MPKFVMFYHMGNTPPADGAAMMERWQVWLAENSGSLLEPENPIGPSKIVAKDGVTDVGNKGLMGYGVLECADLDAAVALAQSCPFLDMGTLEVAEIKSRS